MDNHGGNALKGIQKKRETWHATPACLKLASMEVNVGTQMGARGYFQEGNSISN